MSDYPSWCYIDKRFKMVPFTSEQKIEDFPYQKNVWERTFPEKKGVDITKLRLTNIGRYSVAKLNVTLDLKSLISEIYNLVEKKSLKDLIITESNGGLGGLTITLAPLFKKINVVEIIPEHAEIIKHNISQYNLMKNVKIINDDYMNVMMELKQDIIISDPPWGGLDYHKQRYLRLGLNNIDITCVINKLYDKNLFKLFVLLVPHNFDIKHFMDKIKSKSIFIQKYQSLSVIFVLNLM
jgi:16S rRNA G966 N2-methylase RsmD